MASVWSAGVACKFGRHLWELLTVEAAAPLFHSQCDLWLPASLWLGPHKSKLMVLSLGAEGPCQECPRATSHGLTLPVVSLVVTFHWPEPAQMDWPQLSNPGFNSLFPQAQGWLSSYNQCPHTHPGSVFFSLLWSELFVLHTHKKCTCIKL